MLIPTSVNLGERYESQSIFIQRILTTGRQGRATRLGASRAIQHAEHAANWKCTCTLRLRQKATLIFPVGAAPLGQWRHDSIGYGPPQVACFVLSGAWHGDSMERKQRRDGKGVGRTRDGREGEDLHPRSTLRWNGDPVPNPNPLSFQV